MTDKLPAIDLSGLASGDEAARYAPIPAAGYLKMRLDASKPAGM